MNLKRIVANVKDICNLIGRDEYIIGRILLSVSILYSLNKKQTKKKNKSQQHSISAAGRDKGASLIRFRHV